MTERGRDHIAAVFDVEMTLERVQTEVERLLDLASR
jgi:hypothetical protein